MTNLDPEILLYAFLPLSHRLREVTPHLVMSDASSNLKAI